MEIENKINKVTFYFQSILNKPAAQAAGADPSRWSSDNSQNPSIQQNCRNIWTSNAIWMPFGI